MRFKPLYRYRITDNVYVIYKLSHYSTTPIQEIEAGLAFDNGYYYSRALKKAWKKYGLLESESERGTWTTASTHADFCVSLYLKHFLSKEKVLPANVATICKYHWRNRVNEMKEELGVELVNDK